MQIQVKKEILIRLWNLGMGCKSDGFEWIDRVSLRHHRSYDGKDPGFMVVRDENGNCWRANFHFSPVGSISFYHTKQMVQCFAVKTRTITEWVIK